jgi:hypothetical protein
VGLAEALVGITEAVPDSGLSRPVAEFPVQQQAPMAGVDRLHAQDPLRRDITVSAIHLYCPGG